MCSGRHWGVGGRGLGAEGRLSGRQGDGGGARWSGFVSGIARLPRIPLAVGSTRYTHACELGVCLICCGLLRLSILLGLYCHGLYGYALYSYGL